MGALETLEKRVPPDKEYEIIEKKDDKIKLKLQSMDFGSISYCMMLNSYYLDEVFIKENTVIFKKKETRNIELESVSPSSSICKNNGLAVMITDKEFLDDIGRLSHSEYFVTKINIIEDYVRIVLYDSTKI